MKTPPMVVLMTAALLSVIFLVAAKADGYINTPQGNYTFGTFTPLSPAKIIHAPPMSAEALEHDARWMRECRMTFDMDKYGVMHYNFSRSPMGCEFGYLPGEVR